MKWHRIKGGYTDRETGERFDTIHVLAESPDEAVEKVKAGIGIPDAIDKYTVEADNRTPMTFYIIADNPDRAEDRARLEYAMMTRVRITTPVELIPRHVDTSQEGGELSGREDTETERQLSFF